VFVSAKYTRDTKSNDAMYVWLENVNSGSFEVCIREFLAFDGKHQDTIVVSNTVFAIYNQPYMVCKESEDFTLRQKRHLFQNIRHLRPPSLSLMLLLLYYLYCFFKNEGASKMVQNMRKKRRRREIWKKIIIKSKLALKQNLGLN